MSAEAVEDAATDHEVVRPYRSPADRFRGDRCWCTGKGVMMDISDDKACGSRIARAATRPSGS